jgi:hypothetical protein
MKIERWLLWLMVLLIAFHCFITLETFPEFHVLSPSKLQEIVNPLSGESKGNVYRELIMARWSGEYAQNLAERTLVVDAVMFIIVVGLIVKSYRRRRDAA